MPQKDFVILAFQACNNRNEETQKQWWEQARAEA